MNIDQARAIVLELLRAKGKATNSEMLEAVGGNEAVLRQIREDLILDDLADDKKGVGLVCTDATFRSEASTQSGPSPAAVPDESRTADFVPETREPALGSPSARSSPTKRRVFLSYGRRDAKPLADRLALDLARHGFEVWQDVHQIRSGSDWQERIVDALRQSDAVVALLSPHAVRLSVGPGNPDNTDSVCLDELSYARFGQPPKPIIPVMAITCEPPFCIFRLDYVDLRTWATEEGETQYQAGLRRLLDSIHAALRGVTRFRASSEQLQPWDFADFLAEKRQDFCGRQWLFQELDSWRKASRHERALLITGDPGTGKSAIVAQLVHLNPDGQVLAYHCCQADTEATLEPWRFVRSIAAMIASKIEAYARRLEEPALKEALDEARCRQDPGLAFEQAVLAPLAALDAPPEVVRYLLIDALDEALSYKGSPNLVALLSLRLRRLPHWLRIVATTRRNADVLQALAGLRAVELDAQDHRNLADIGEYIAGRLHLPQLRAQMAASGRHDDEVVHWLRERSEGNFLYVQQALDGIEREVQSFEDVKNLPPGLDGLYVRFFQRCFPDEASFAAVRRVLEVVVASQEPLSAAELAAATGWDSADLLAQGLEPLAVYLRARGEPGQPPRFALYHKSLADWLSDPRQSRALHFADPAQGHRQLAAMCWNAYQTAAATMPRYALAHLPVHLAAAGRWEDVRQALTNLHYMQAKCQAGMVFDLQRDFQTVLDAFPAGQEERNEEDQRREQLTVYAQGLLAFAREWASVRYSAEAEATPSSCWRRWRSWIARRGRSAAATPRSAQAGVPNVVLPPPPDTCPTHWAMRAAEARTHQASAEQTAGTQTGIDVLRALAKFVSSHTDALSGLPEETVIHARNYASEGAVVELAEPLAAALSRAWIARNFRPPMPPLHPLSVRVLRGHERWVRAVALTPDGRFAVSGGDDGTVRVWHLSTGEPQWALEGHAGAVTGVAITADGKTAVSVSRDGTACVWDLHSGRTTHKLPAVPRGLSSVAITPDGSLIVVGRYGRSLLVWDVGGAEPRTWRLHGHREGVSCVAVTADGRTAVSGSSDRTLCLWDLDGRRPTRVLHGHNSGLTAVAMTPDGKTIVSASQGRNLRVWDGASGRQIRTLEGHSGRVQTVAVTPDGHTAFSVASDMTLRTWDLTSGTACRVFRGHTLGMSAVALTPDAKTGVTASHDGTLGVWNLAHGTSTATPEMHTLAVKLLALSADAKRVLSASHDRSLKIWDLDSGHLIAALQGHTGQIEDLVVSADGRHAVTASQDETIRMWDLQTLQEVRTLVGHASWVHGLALTPDGNTALCPNDDRGIHVWDLPSGRERCVLQGHRAGVRSLVLSHDGKTAMSGGWDRDLLIWDLATGTLLRTLCGHSLEINCLALTPDGRHVVSGSSDYTLRVWDVQTGEVRAVLEGHSQRVRFVALTPDGRIAVSASDDRTVRSWDLVQGRPLGVLTGHKGAVRSVAITPDGSLAVSISKDTTVRLWDLQNCRPLAAYDAAASLLSVSAIRPDGCFACGASDGQVHLLQLRNVSPALPAAGPGSTSQGNATLP
jgi:WD40 repeat protein